MEQLTWSDIITKGMTKEDYLEKFADKEEIIKNYADYEPKQDIIEKIKKILTDNEERLRVLSIGASWCPDCTVNLPAAIKIFEDLEGLISDFKIIYGVKVDVYKKKNKERVAWSERHSPPEATNPKFDLKKIPIIYIFNKNGKFINRIVENPEKASLEADILSFLE
jgi:hypothetical protein